MVGPKYDLVMNPIEAVRSTFREAFPSHTDPDDIADADWGVRPLFSHFLSHQNGLSQVPVFDRMTNGLIPSNTLVRLRGMIQDTMFHELYIGAFKDGSDWKSNRYMEFSEAPRECDLPTPMLIWTRHVYHCVSIPGLNQWAQPHSEEMLQRLRETSAQREKRKLDDPMDLSVSGDRLEGSPSAKKMREGEHSSESTQPQEPSTTSSSNVQSIIPMDSLSCVVKIYDAQGSVIKINEVYEFIGIFTSDPKYPDFEDYFASEEHEHLPQLPPRIKVPCLHCIIHRKLGLDDFLLKPSAFPTESKYFREVREHLLRHLTDVLGGDGLAAEFMLLHLLSKVHRRNDRYVVGKFSLNLYGFSNESAVIFRTLLRTAIGNILPFSNYVPVTIETLNAASFVQKKDQHKDRLITGPLQVADGTHLILDMTEIEQGGLNQFGIANVFSLKDVFELQKVYCDFEFYQLEFFTDIQLLVLSKEKSRLCPADSVLPFRPSRHGNSEGPPDYVDAFRWYLAKVKSLPFTIEPQVQQRLADDLVLEKRVEWNLGAGDFNRLVTMSQLICTSFGETTLSWDHWRMVIQLESQRRQRLIL